MKNSPPDEFWDPEAEARRQREQEAETIRYVARLNKEWQTDHAKRAAEFETELTKESPRATFEDKLLVKLISHDFALSEVLGEAEIQLARRVAMMVDNAKVVLALARALRETSACRGATERRIEGLMQTRSVLRGQHKLAEIAPLRRVA